MQRRELPAGWDRNLPVFPADAKGVAGRDASGQGAQRSRAEHPVVPRRLRRSRTVEQDDAQVRRRGRLRARDAERQEPALRHPRARDGRDRERPVAFEAAGVRRDVLHLQRLRAAGDPPVGADGAADDLRVHARRDGRWRGRTDASADRAACVAARDPGTDVDPARRCQRGRRGVSLRDAAAAPAGGARAVAPAVADARPDASTRRLRAWREAPMCSPTRPAASRR